MSLSIMIASSDEHFRDVVRENLMNFANARVVAEFNEVNQNLYIRVLQELDRHPEAALILDIAHDLDASIQALRKVKQAVPDLYLIASSYTADGEHVIMTVRAGANDFLVQPIKRLDFRDAIDRLERTPRRTGSTQSKLGKIYTFLGTKGGVGTTTLAVNFASVLAQRKQQSVLIDLDWTGNDCAMQLGAAPQYTLVEVGENLDRMDRALFEGFVMRDPIGFYLVGPPDSLENAGYFTEPQLRDFTTFLVEQYESIVIDAGRLVNTELVLGALQVSSQIFLCCTQEFPTIRNAQRYLGFLGRMGFNQDQIKVVVNQYRKDPGPGFARLDQIQQTLNQPVFYGVPRSQAVLNAVNKARPFVANREESGDLDRAFRAFVDKATGRKKEAELAKSA
ncbi:MAG: AAA family ATPase [Bryobacteraceae bacterium]|nr:AAA family ATPase [Bryobacteraceae bacterium]